MLDLHHILLGEASNPPLIILHGLFGSHANWRTLAKEFARTHAVYLLDLRNHGKSPWNASMSYVEMAGDVARFIKSQQIHNPIILGHSMGGKTAMTLAQKRMVGISRLIIADIAPVPYRHSHEEFVAAMQHVDFDQVSSRNDVDRQLTRDIANSQVRLFLLQNLTREGERYQWRINLDAISENMPQLLDYRCKETSNVEALFIAGSLSHYITSDHHHSIRHLFPSAYIETISGAGHWLHAEQPRRFIELVQNFL